MTKKVFILFAAFSAVTTYYSCTPGSKRQESQVITPEMEFRNSLSHEDSVKLLDLANNCMELLKNRDIDGAVALLNEYDDSTGQVNPLSQESVNRMRRTFKIFPVLKYELEYYSVMLEGRNDIRYKIWFAEEDEPDKNGEPVTHFMFNPVMVDNEWHLCVKNPGQLSDDKLR